MKVQVAYRPFAMMLIALAFAGILSCTSSQNRRFYTVVPSTQNGQTIEVSDVQLLRVALEGEYAWDWEFSDRTMFFFESQMPVIGKDFTAIVLSFRIDHPGPVTLRATGTPHCRSQEPPCDTPIQNYEVNIVIK